MTIINYKTSEIKGFVSGSSNISMLLLSENNFNIFLENIDCLKISTEFQRYDNYKIKTQIKMTYGIKNKNGGHDDVTVHISKRLYNRIYKALKEQQNDKTK